MADIANAERLIFPGVGAYEQAMGVLTSKRLHRAPQGLHPGTQSSTTTGMQHACNCMQPSMKDRIFALHAA